MKPNPISKCLLLILLVGVLCVGVNVGCSKKKEKSDGRLQVVASFSILGDWVREVGGDQIALRVLVDAGEDAHVYQPTPQDLRILTSANLVFENGLHFEPWLDDLYGASHSEAKRVTVSEKKSHNHSNSHKEEDPHLWLDVENTIKAVEIIRAALSQNDPKNAATYQANANSYVKRLKILDATLQEQVESLPAAKRLLVTSHDSFGYFARRYGLTIVGNCLESHSTEASDPSAAEVSSLIRKIRESGVSAIFVEESHHSHVMEQIARETGVKLIPGLYTDALGGPESQGSDYIKMMKANARMLVEGLQ